MNDDAATLLALETLLENGVGKEDCEVVAVSSGEDALRLVLTQEFAVIILDVNMPGMDGFETAEAIHSHPRSASIPIIFVTAHYGDEINRLKGYQNGAVDYLFTPVIPQILLSKVAVFVELAKNKLDLQRKTIELEALNQDLQTQRMLELKRLNMALEAEIVERRQAEQRAHELATKDPLTRLPNRRSLLDRLHQAIAHAARHKEILALLFLDLDKFKLINDTLGHEAGDALLIQVAARIGLSIRESDMVCRLGGDEFVVLLERLSHAGDAVEIAKKISHAIEQPYDIGPNGVTVSTSIGISLYGQDGTSAQALMQHADLAMYHAKKQKQGGIQFYQEDFKAHKLERVELEEDLQQALAQGNLELRYLPKIALASGKICGAEAVLYWHHPQSDARAVAQLLPVDADYKLRASLNEWIISAACKQLKQWADSASANLEIPITINVASIHIAHQFAEQLRAHVNTYGVAASCLQLEIAEAQLGSDFERTATLLHTLSDQGFSIAIGNFGAGDSSLLKLKTLPIHALHLDHSFILELEKEKKNTDLVAGLISIARALRVQIGVGGVQTLQQAEILKELRCDHYQGVPFHEPVSADMLQRLLSK